LAALAFWLIAGIWLEIASFMLAFKMPLPEAASIGLKEAVTGLINTALGFLAFILVRWWTVRGRGGDLPIRGLAFAAMLAAVSIPSFGLVFVLSRQLTHFTTLTTGVGLPGGQVAPPPDALADLPEDHELLLPSFAMLLGVLAAGVIVSDSLGRVVQRQFDAPMQPLRQATSGGLPRLPAAGIRELNELIQAINDRGNQVATLADSLQTARAQLEQTAYDLTENIPVGTYTMVQPPDGGMARFEFMSTRFLELTGLEREAARADPLNAFACVHPDDYEEWVRKNAYVFEHTLPFKEECRVVVAGQTRWIIAESTPRGLPDGSTVWEGVLTDITEQKLAERALAESRDRERRAEERMQETLRQKLKTSLTAAAVAHEINQPLSRLLLRAQLERAAGSGGDGNETLDSLIADAERVVLTIEKMNVLLRNVETAQELVALDAVVESGLIQVKQLLRRHGVSAEHLAGGPGCVVMGDDVQLQTIVTNLIRNAAEAIGQVSSPRREVLIECHRHDDDVELVVGDSGPGWPGGTIEDVLLESTKPQGTGIGLYVVKTAVENHRGTVTVGRSPLGGAEFRIVFPAGPAGPGSVTPTDAAAKP